METTRRALALYGELRNAIEFVVAIGGVLVTCLVYVLWLDNQPVPTQIAGVLIVFCVTLLVLAAVNRFVYQPRWAVTQHPQPVAPAEASGDTRTPTVRRAQDEPVNRLEWVTCSGCAHAYQVSVPTRAILVELGKYPLGLGLDTEYEVPCPSCGRLWWVRATVTD